MFGEIARAHINRDEAPPQCVLSRSESKRNNPPTTMTATSSGYSMPSTPLPLQPTAEHCSYMPLTHHIRRAYLSFDDQGSNLRFCVSKTRMICPSFYAVLEAKLQPGGQYLRFAEILAELGPTKVCAQDPVPPLGWRNWVRADPVPPH